MRYRYLDELIAELTKLRNEHGNLPIDGRCFFPYEGRTGEDLYIPSGVELEIGETYISRHVKGKELMIVHEEG